jgi:hypothetical protein
MSSRLVALVTILAVLAAGGAVADASRKAKRGESVAIALKLQAQGLDCARYPADTCILKVFVSTRNKRWAVARVRATINGESFVQPEDISLHSKGKRKRKHWRVVSIGHGGGCGVPQKIRRDLHLICLPS